VLASQLMDVFDTGEVAAVADERTTLGAFLDYYREAVKGKVRGVSEEDARRRLVPSMTTLAGLVKHLYRVEVSWFENRLAQIPFDDLPALQWIKKPDGDFVVSPDETLDTLIAQYEEQCQRSRQIMAEYELDHVVPHPALGHVSMRWIVVHMIEETARHAGHADILREQIDGTTGD
jgi:uncharacterized damage-inducible protein DinB